MFGKLFIFILFLSFGNILKGQIQPGLEFDVYGLSPSVQYEFKNSNVNLVLPINYNFSELTTSYTEFQLSQSLFKKKEYVGLLFGYNLNQDSNYPIMRIGLFSNYKFEIFDKLTISPGLKVPFESIIYNNSLVWRLRAWPSLSLKYSL